MVGTVAPAGGGRSSTRPATSGGSAARATPSGRATCPVREETIPVGGPAGCSRVVSRHTNLAAARTPSRLELTYLQSAADLAQMVAEGRFPFAAATSRSWRARRGSATGCSGWTGAGCVTYASPNALSAYRRLGPGRRPGRRPPR